MIGGWDVVITGLEMFSSLLSAFKLATKIHPYATEVEGVRSRLGVGESGVRGLGTCARGSASMFARECESEQRCRRFETVYNIVGTSQGGNVQ